MEWWGDWSITVTRNKEIGSDRGQIWGTVWGFIPKDWRKTRNIAVRLADVCKATILMVRIEKTTLFRTEDRGSTLLRNRYTYLPIYTVSDSTTEWSSRDRTVHLMIFRMWYKGNTTSLLPDTDDTKKVPSQKYKTPLHQYKIQGDTKSTVQDASSSVQDTRGCQVKSTRRQLFSTRYKRLSSQQYKTPVLQYKIQSITKLTVQDARSSI